ncbi:MAG TPA: helix-turn-helix domain-containing protein [Solirubrobacteraceae bacterium]|nr:helix-turn-helix domain-containing protein [Solirubrobacteraceae bacterium]
MPQVPPPKRHPYNQWSPDARALDLVGDKWTLLIVRDLAAGPRRFVELQRVLPGISTEQLRSRLNRMVADGMLTRQRFREVPPRVDYELTERARELLPVLGELARWGYEWSWSSPRENELVDIGAIIRLAPGLVHPPQKLAGSVELLVTDAGPQHGTLSYLVTISHGEVTLSEHEDSSAAAAHIRGSQGAWIQAFAPAGTRDGLEITGDQRLAAGVLDDLARSEHEAPPVAVAAA